MRLDDYWRSAPLRIAATYTVIFGLSFLLILAVIYWAAGRDVEEQIRQTIDQDVRVLRNDYEQQGIKEIAEDIRVLAKSVEANRSLYLLQDSGGNIVASAGTTEVMSPFEGWQEKPFLRAAKRPDHFILFGTQLGEYFLAVGRRAHPVWEVHEAVLKSFAWGLGAMIPLALLGGFIMGQRSFRRVEAIGSSMREIAEGDLSRRVPVTGTGDEIDRLARDINRVLQEIERLMDQLKQVTSDIAHDLRTPLGRLRQGLERAVDKETTVAGYRGGVEKSITEIDGILSTFNAILHIAQIEAGKRRARFAEFSLSELGQSVLDIYGSVAEDSLHELEDAVAPGVTVRGDRDLLMQLLVNLVENAICHTPAGTHIRLVVAHESDRPTLLVSDDGPGIPADERERVFRRFYRLDSSRTTPGSGLGLALAEAIANLHGAVIELADNQPGLRVVVRFAY
ncbi:sensor histidine kinase [Hypericibacter sp.]|uniref:sensor histidine kinase n=1 Tax=Hypericibacter sp. TaxID=2705401 RepID=UPI003D6CA634